MPTPALGAFHVKVSSVKAGNSSITSMVVSFVSFVSLLEIAVAVVVDDGDEDGNDSSVVVLVEGYVMMVNLVIWVHGVGGGVVVLLLLLVLLSSSLGQSPLVAVSTGWPFVASLLDMLLLLLLPHCPCPSTVSVSSLLPPVVDKALSRCTYGLR